MNKIFPIFEYILWNNCANNCLFCHQKHKLEFSSDIEKIKAITCAQNEILKTKEDNFHVLLVGGELFDTLSNDVFNKLNDLIDTIILLMNCNKIIYFYVNTNLLYDLNLYLIPVLNKFKFHNLLSRVKFTTSDDVYGRFLTDYKKQLFTENLSYIRSNYSELPVVVNSILTKQFCEYVITSNKSFTKYYNDKFGCYVNLLPYVALDSALTPHANDVFKTLIVEHVQNTGYIDNYLRDISIVQDKHVFKYVNDKFTCFSADKSICGHVVNFKSYCDDRNTCYVCDILELFKNAT